MISDRYVRKSAKATLREARKISRGNEAMAEKLKQASDALAQGLADDNIDGLKAHIGTAQRILSEKAQRTSWAKSAAGLGGIISAVAVALWLRGCVVGAFSIPSPSMVPTLLPGDFLFVNKLSYAVKVPYTDIILFRTGSPKRGEIVVFPSPCEDKTLIKRIVATSGDTVEMRCERLYINGKEVVAEPAGEVPYCHDDNGAAGNCALYTEKLGDTTFTKTHIWGLGERADFPIPDADMPGEEFVCTGQNGQSYRRPDAKVINGRTKVYAEPGECRPYAHYTVPDGYVMMMGDNRRNSTDGQMWGPVPIDSITGRAVFIFASKDNDESFLKFWKYRPARMGKFIHETD